MKNVFLGISVFLIIFSITATSCTKEKIVDKVITDTVYQVEKPIDVIDSVQNYLNSLGDLTFTPSGAASVLRTDLKQVAATQNYDMYSFYVGDHRLDRQDIAGVAGYGNDGTIIVICWENATFYEGRVYEWSGSGAYVYEDYASITQKGFVPVDDFAKNTYIGIMTKGQLLSSK